MSGASNIVAQTALQIFSDTVNAIKEISIEKGIQQTQRTLIREHAKVLISQIENNTQLLRDAIANDHELHMRTIEVISDLLVGKDVIDDSIIEICRTVLLPLVISTPMLNSTLNTSSYINTKNNLMIK
ncbi:hypothetical protein [Clostridium sp.]|uniref:hypothetical protein n=1 Tax=Clostridium sp. TaxID=1506 RepID=UPI003D6CAF35